MRRLKIVVYFLILGILSSLLGNVSFAWASTQDKLVITEIYDLDLASAPPHVSGWLSPFSGNHSDLQ